MVKSKEENIAKVNAGFDTIEESLTKMAIDVKQLMPLVSDSLLLTIKIIKVYREAFNNGITTKE